MIRALLYWLEAPALIVPCNSGVTYQNQVAGQACVQAELEGALIPVGRSNELEQAFEDLVFRTGGLVEKDEWATGDSRRALQDKINAYLVYALDGQLASDYADIARANVSFIIHSVDPIPATATVFIDQLKSAVATHGICLEVLPL